MVTRLQLLLLLFCAIFVVRAQDIDSTYIAIQKKLDTATTKESRLELLLQIGDYLLEKDIYKAQDYFKKAQSLVNEDDFANKAKVFKFLGSAAHRQGDYSETLMYYMKSKDFYEKIHDTANVANILLKEGMVYKQSRENNKAIKKYKECIRLAKKINDSSLIGRSYLTMGGSYRRLRKLDSSFYYYNKAMAIFKSLKNEVKISNVRNDLAIIYGFQKRYDKALETHLNNLDFVKKNHGKTNLAVTYFNIAYSYFKLKDYKTSLIYLDSSHTVAKNGGFKQRLSRIADVRSRVYAEMQDFEKAYEYQIIFKKYSDTIFDLKKQKQLKELELKNTFNKEKKELEVVANEKEMKSRLYLMLFVLILVFGSTIGFLVWRDYKARTQIVKSKYEKEKLKKEVLSQKVKASETELKHLIADNTMRLEFIKQLSKQIKQDKDSSESKSVQEYANLLLLKLQQQITTENKLSLLQDKINAVNQEFDKHIINLYPNLTKTEREVCSLLRLNLSIKEIASIRNSSIDSIKALRYRIRKKMEVPKQQELESFIQNLFA
ncbi:tetratricopeptide repeat protein [Tenacibaculum amylolyticum]|uniref:tetratricopeptide repeat protein n=1 Tax=Tenacibaculum amylolyticum TaxID=104269 RepID=UPI003892EE16